MNEYSVKGMHCEECAQDIEQKLKQVTDTNQIKIDYPHRKAYIPQQTDMEKVNRVAAFEKFVLQPVTEEEHEHHGHHHEHDHGHDHSHHHAHDIDFASGERAAKNMKIVFFINIAFSILEFLFGILFNSAAILTDAVHDLGDAISIGLAWFFQKISTREADEKYSFGHQRFSSLGALITGVVLLAGSALLILNTLPRLFNPQPVHYEGMFWLAIFAIAANGYSAWLMSRGSSTNESMLNLHLLEDVLGWVGVLVVSVVVRFTGWHILDPLLSLAIAGFIIYKTWPLFQKTAEIFLDAVPRDVHMKSIRKDILALPSVHNLSHLHIWSIDGEEHAMAVTISTDELSDLEEEELKETIRQIVAKQNITHTTIEIMADPEQWLR
ncbi:cation diffusion facilitator family transporter [Jeotgalibaca caeni]|uniref:cation diffusion facilitator family transporter n=1 Tax=Jeotgalibaca caeni TaxID=3028623 RepID=UPI00237DB7B8|nr:cation diffusion facilitator family transporter [Jeotgalibaca caeni]MDE1548924.1 cation diffusion facilitator family transporter [Jeotgalibaca caeni]